MRAGMPADHDGFSTGKSPVSAKVGQTNRTDWNTPARPVRLAKCCRDAFDAGRDARGP